MVPLRRAILAATLRTVQWQNKALSSATEYPTLIINANAIALYLRHFKLLLTVSVQENTPTPAPKTGDVPWAIVRRFKFRFAPEFSTKHQKIVNRIQSAS